MAITASEITTSNTLEQFRQQYNNLVTDVTGLENGTQTFTATTTTTSNVGNLNVLEDGTIVFEGATDDAHETTLTVVDPTADRTVSLPNASGTVIISDASTNIVTIPDDLIIKDGGTIGATSAATAITIASTGIVTFVDDLLIKDGGTIGNASVAAVMTLASTGIVTFADDILIKDGGTIGAASATTAITIASTGIVTFVDDILIKDGGTIGAASATTAITIASTGIVTLVDDLLIKDGGTIGNASVAAVMTLASTGIVTFADDILIKDGGTIGNASVAAVMTLADSGIVTFADDIIIKDGGTIGSATDPDAISIGSDGDVTLTQDLELQHDGAILSFGGNDEITLTHVHDVGLTLTHTATGDNTPIVLQLKSEEDIIVADEVIASLEFAAGDSDGTDAADVAAGIHAIAEGTFGADANATKLVFTTAVQESANSAATAKMTLSSAGLLTIADDFMIKDGGTIGVASANDAMTISSAGIVTFKDDIILKDAATIGVASSTSAISIASTGIVTFVDDIIIKDSGTIGSATIPTAISITNTGEVTINNSTSGTASAPFVIRRDNNSNGNGVALVYELGDSGSATAGHGYARIFGTIEDSTNGAEDGALRFDTSNGGTLAQRFNIASDGTLTGSDTDGIGSLSDSRIKESVSDYTYSLSTFKQFTPKTFDWKNPSAHLNKSSDRGFLAQEVNAIDSALIYKTPIDAEHPDASLITADSDGIRRPYASKLAGKDAMYVSVIKQLITKIETLETKVATLEGG